MADDWSFALYRELEDPNKIVLSSSQAVVLRDTYPKAKYHYLIVPKILKLENVFELSGDHLPLLDDMFQLAKKLIDSLKMQPKEFLIGFKLDPSMNLLNLHVISTDFNSKHMKRDYHWTNFHTKIFLPYNAAYDQLKNKGHIDHLTEDELNEARSAPWKCHRCDFQSNTWFVFKYHLPKHWEVTQNPRVQDSWRQSRLGPVSQNRRTPFTQRDKVPAAQPNAPFKLPQSSSTIKPQPSLKERVEALNKMLETVFITTTTTTESTPTTSDSPATTEPSLNEDDLGCDQEASVHKENICEHQQEQSDESNVTLSKKEG